MFFKILSLFLLLGQAIGQNENPFSVNIVGGATKYVKLDDNFNMSCTFKISFSEQTTGVISYESFMNDPNVQIKWKAVFSGHNNPPFTTMVGQWPNGVYTDEGYYVAQNVGEELISRIQTSNATITSSAEDEYLEGQSWMQIDNIAIGDQAMNPIECLTFTTKGTTEGSSRLSFNVYAIPTVAVLPGIGQSTDQREPIIEVEVPTTAPSNNATEEMPVEGGMEADGDMEAEGEAETDADAGATGDNNTDDDLDYGNNEDGISRRRRQAGGEEVEVAICNVEGVYPAIENVTFTVGESKQVVPVGVRRENDDGTYSYDVSLFLAVQPDLNGQAISCSTGVRTSLDYVENVQNAPEEDVTIEVLYDTTEINIAINGDTTSPQDMNTHTVFRITCSANGNPQPEAYEILLGNVMDENIIGNSQFMDYELSDSGSNEPTYITCRTYNRNNIAIDSQPMELTATYIGQASISNADESMELTVGEDMYLVCVAESSNPPASFQWKYINDNTGDVSDVETTNGILQISNLQFADSGTYTCEASNSAGITEDSVVVNIVGKCSAELKSYIGNAIHQPADGTTETGHIRLECITTGNPPCSVKFQPDEHVGKTPEFTEMEDGKIKWTVTYDNFIKLSSPFNVSCSAENEHGKVLSNIQLVDDEAVVEPPADPTGLSTGVIILIIIIVVIVVVGVPVGCYYVQRRKKSSSKSINAKEADLESTNEEDEREKLNANSEESLPPPPSEMQDERFGQDMTTFSTQK